MASEKNDPELEVWVFSTLGGHRPVNVIDRDVCLVCLNFAPMPGGSTLSENPYYLSISARFRKSTAEMCVGLRPLRISSNGSSGWQTEYHKELTKLRKEARIVEPDQRPRSRDRHH